MQSHVCVSCYLCPACRPNLCPALALADIQNVMFVRAGLSAGAPLDVEAIVGDLTSPKERQAKLSDAAYETVKQLYLQIEAAIEDPSKGKASGFAQPWLS